MNKSGNTVGSTMKSPFTANDNRRLRNANPGIDEFLEIETRLNRQVQEEPTRMGMPAKSPKALLSRIISKTPNYTSIKRSAAGSSFKDSVDLTNRRSKIASNAPNNRESSKVIKQTSPTAPISQSKALIKYSHIDGMTDINTDAIDQPEDKCRDIKASVNHDDEYNTDRVQGMDDIMISKQCTDIKSKVNQILAKYKISLHDESLPKPSTGLNGSDDNILGKVIDHTSMPNETSRESSRILKDLNDSPMALEQHITIYKREIRRHINQEVLKVGYSLTCR